MAINHHQQEAQKVRADSYDECVAIIRKAYGPNYEILRRSEYAPEGVFGFLKKKQYEIQYVVHPQRAKPLFSGSPLQSAQMDFNEEKNKILEANKNTQSSQMKLILDEIKELRTQIDEKTSSVRQDVHPSISTIEDLLEKNEFTSQYIKKISEKIKSEFSIGDLDDFNAVQTAVIDWIGESILIDKPKNNSRPEIIVLVGPTGVGKTTTVAKLAANHISGLLNKSGRQDLKIRLITIDSLRIGAKEQLETYGELMSIPVSFANTVDDLQQLITLYAHDVDIILVDTSGHSPKDYESLAKMRKTLDFRGQKPQVFLTVSASIKANDLRTILQQYEIFGYSSIIVTKIDETDSIGTIVSVLDEKQKKIAYVTDGQKVPRNFKKADPVTFLINLEGFKVNREHIDEKFIQDK